ncbi:MAG: efflux RND transporter permease subunit [Candidatus Sumerlaeaceae bacterium]|nr:efflux RND transporter permease subunit [Candidatus Sumerlaeaceae bacterium]
MSLASISIKNPVFAWMLMIGFIVFGVISFNRLGVSQNPDVDFPFVTVTATLEGAAPEIMESDVVDVIEDSVMAVEGVKEVTSTCRQGSASIKIEFTLNTSIDQALQDVQARIAQAGKSLPKDMDPPIVAKQNPEEDPIMWMALTGTRSQQELTQYAKNSLRDRFLTVPGVGEVRMGGFLDRNVRIWIKSDELRARDLGINEVVAALQRQHVEMPAGRIEGQNRVANVRIEGEALNVETMRNLQVAMRGSAPVYLKDVALVEDGFEDKTRVARSNGLPAQGMGVIKQRGFSAVEVADAVRKRIAEIQPTLPQGMELNIRVDNTKYIKTAIHEIEFDLTMAVLLTAFVCWLFLGSLSSTFNVVLAIPVALFGTFAVMYFANFTLNTFSLLALGLCIGIVVDDAIMVLENIYRHAEEGEDRVTAARKGTEQITTAALAATLAIVAIFLPVAFMQGIIGKFFFQFGVVISVAVLISLLEALTLAPARCSQFLSVGGRGNIIERAIGRFFHGLSRFYAFVLGIALRWRVTVLAIATAIFVASLYLVGGLKKEMVPTQDQGFFMCQFTTPVGSSIEYTDRQMSQLEKILKNTPEVEGMLAIAGTSDLNSGFIFVTLKDKEKGERTANQIDIINKLRPQLNSFPGTRVSLLDFSQQGFSGGRSFPVEYTVRGPDWSVLAQTAGDVMTKMRNSGLMVDVDTDYRVGLPEIQVLPDRLKALANDVDVEEIASTINSLIGGARVAKYKDNGRRYDVRVRLLKEDRLRPEDITSLYVRNSKGRLVPLSEVTSISVQPSLQSITRKQRERAITITANAAPGHSQDEALKKMKEFEKELPTGYRLVASGASQAFQESTNSLVFAMFLGLLTAYMVLGSQFNSFIHPVTVLMALPFAVTGALLALVVTGCSLNIYSLIGVILLFGIVKKNSILLVDYTNQMREQGMGADEALKHAGPIRLRPIMMTTFAMMAGALPGALAHGVGSEVRSPMNIAIIGGLIVSTMLTLVVVPCFYSLIDQADATARRWLGIGKQKTEAADVSGGEALGK